MEEKMRNYNKPTIELLAISSMDIIQSSPANSLAGNDPYLTELDSWVRSDAGL